MSKETVLDNFYRRSSWMSCWISRERDVPMGTVRMIDEKLHYVFAIHPKWMRAPEVLWAEVRTVVLTP